ncbi:MAG: hypothetical protein QXX17_02635 [Conexivisphaerales archaeon]
MTQQPAEDIPAVRKWAGRRRALGVVGGLSLAFAPVIFSEMDHPLFTVDDLTVTILGAIILIVYLVLRNRTSLSSLKSQTNLFTAIALVGLIVKFAWIFVELGDPDAFGDDMSSLVLIIVILANRFL